MIIMTETQLPDFEDMFGLSEEIADLMLRKLVLETQIANLESKAMKDFMANEKINGKPPSMEYLKLVVKPVGKNDELIPIRLELAQVKSKLEGNKLIFDTYKSMIGVWQTESANKRAVSL